MKNSISKILNKLYSSDLSQYCNYDYDTERHCREEGCREEGICRCGKIVNFQIKSVDTPAIAKDVSAGTDSMTKYLVDRVVRTALISIDNLEADIGRGYYGQELRSIKIANTETVTNDSKSIIMKELLMKEYGWLLPELVAADFEITEVDISDIEPAQKDHYSKLNKAALDYYRESIKKDVLEKQILPICLCREVDALAPGKRKFQLIDGYHRYRAASNLGLQAISIVVAVPNKGARGAE